MYCWDNCDTSLLDLYCWDRGNRFWKSSRNDGIAPIPCCSLHHHLYNKDALLWKTDEKSNFQKLKNWNSNFILLMIAEQELKSSRVVTIGWTPPALSSVEDCCEGNCKNLNTRLSSTRSDVKDWAGSLLVLNLTENVWKRCILEPGALLEPLPDHRRHTRKYHALTATIPDQPTNMP